MRGKQDKDKADSTQQPTWNALAMLASWTLPSIARVVSCAVACACGQPRSAHAARTRQHQGTCAGLPC